MELDYSDKAKDELLRAGQLFQDRSLFSTVDALYLDAITATVRRDFPSAINAYAQIAKLQPEQSHVYVDLGRAYEKNNQYDKATENYATAAAKDPQNATAYLRLGVLEGRKKRDAEALAAFDKADMIYQALGNVEGRAEVALQRGVFLNDTAGKVNEARVQLEQAREMAKVVNNAYQQVKILFQLSSVAIKQGQADEAQRFANEAIQLAQANQMETLIARGNNEIGNVYFLRGQYGDAEKHFQIALDAAQRYGARENEARARLSLASSYMQRGETDLAVPLIAQALAFYQPGNYQAQTWNAYVLRARGYKQKGDYKAALQSFREQLKFAEQNGDEAQIAYMHGSLGVMLAIQEDYAEARQHFDENRARNHALGNQLNEGYALVNLGVADWKLGKYAEATQALEQASQIANQGASFLPLQANVHLAEAEIALANQKPAEAEISAKQAFDLVGAEDKTVAVEARKIMCVAAAQSGRAAAGLTSCQQAVDAVAGLGDPLLLAESRLALAEAAFAAGEAKRALENAQQAQAFFGSSGLLERNWRAWLWAGLASQKLADRTNAETCFKNAGDALSSLEQKWGADIFKSYQERPATQFYRGKLDQLSASLR
jgi:tetratricopeptide (TPR) repeat protein